MWRTREASDLRTLHYVQRRQTAPTGELILYQTEDGRTGVECRFYDETLWLSQALMAELFQVSVPTINEHLKGIFADGEVESASTIRSFRIVWQEGSRQVARSIEHYNLYAILAVGYRIRSARGTQFRRWATERLREYLVKGFTMDDEQLKNPDQGVYFEQLLERLRDLRSSEKVFWRKVLEIYATSVDYDPHADTSGQFFTTIQNKMHWATHGRTAAEMIADRADARKAHMGLTNFSVSVPKRAEAKVAKNYLSAEELDTLNRIVGG